MDARRRVALGKFGNPEHTRYLVTEHPDGTLMLTPLSTSNKTAQAPAPKKDNLASEIGFRLSFWECLTLKKTIYGRCRPSSCPFCGV